MGESDRKLLGASAARADYRGGKNAAVRSLGRDSLTDHVAKAVRRDFEEDPKSNLAKLVDAQIRFCRWPAL